MFPASMRAWAANILAGGNSQESRKNAGHDRLASATGRRQWHAAAAGRGI